MADGNVDKRPDSDVPAHGIGSFLSFRQTRRNGNRICDGVCHRCVWAGILSSFPQEHYI